MFGSFYDYKIKNRLVYKTGKVLFYKKWWPWVKLLVDNKKRWVHSNYVLFRDFE